MRELNETVTGMTQAPRAALNELEQRIETLRELLSVRENLLVAAIAEHEDLAQMSSDSIAKMHDAMDTISETFRRAMRPTPIVENCTFESTEAMGIAAE